MHSAIKISLCVVVTEVAYLAVVKLFSKILCKSRENTLTHLFRESISCDKTSSEFHKVLFFPDPGVTCRKTQADRICRDPKCKGVHSETSIGTLIKMMNLTRVSVDICIYLFTSNVLGDALVECHKRGVIVRVIIDDRNSGEAGDVSCSQVGKLREAGISVCCYNGTFWMHHKFMVLDREIVATGSFNWTNTAAMGNLENLLVTSQPELVKPFVKEFEDLYTKIQLEAIQEFAE